MALQTEKHKRQLENERQRSLAQWQAKKAKMNKELVETKVVVKAHHVSGYSVPAHKVGKYYRFTVAHNKYRRSVGII